MSSGAHYAAWIYPEGSPSSVGEKTLALVKFYQWDLWGYGADHYVPMIKTNLLSVGTDWHPLKLVFNTNHIEVYYHGTNILSMSDTETNHFSYPTEGVSVDMWTSGSGPSYNMLVDDVIVTPVQ